VPAGGQLSQYTFYVHYRDSSGEHRAGTPQEGDTTPENLRILDPPRNASATEALGEVQTADGKLRIRVRASLPLKTVAALEFVLKNVGADPLENVRLSTYANLETHHDEANDSSALDASTAGLLVFDPPTGTCAAMAGLHEPVTGYSGVWNSIGKLQAAEGVPLAQWKPFSGPPPELMRRIAREALAARGIYLPYSNANPATPQTRALSPEEAEDALRRDWLFQAMGRNLFERSAAEIGWASSLCERLSALPGAPDFAPEIAELAELDRRLHAAGGEGPR